MKDNHTETKNAPETDAMRIPWLYKFDSISNRPSKSEDPDIDFVTRLRELEGK